jgi:hypothetical protein
MGDARSGQALQAGRALMDTLAAPDHPEHHFVFDGAKYELYVGPRHHRPAVPGARFAQILSAICP